MKGPDHDGRLSIDEAPEFERLETRISHVTWLVLLVVMGATLLGVFGDGLLSHARANDPQHRLLVEYEQVGRYGSRIPMVIRASPDERGLVTLLIPPTYLEAMRFRSISPQPDSVHATPAGVAYQFTAPANDGMVTIRVEVEPVRSWWVVARFESGGAAAVVKQFIFP